MPAEKTEEVYKQLSISTEKMPKEASTQIETEVSEPKETETDSDVEVKEAKMEIPEDVERKLEEYDIPKEFVEKYGLKLAEYYCQEKIDSGKLAEYYGSELGKHYHIKNYSFPALENSHAFRERYAQAIEDEGGIYMNFNKKRRIIFPSIEYSNTSKELIEKTISLMRDELPEPLLCKK